jgi:hypothetical protein
MPAIAIVAYLSFMGHLIGGLLSWRIIAHLADQLPPMFFGGKAPLIVVLNSSPVP